MTNMVIANKGWGGLLRAAAVIIAVLVVPLGASANGMGNHAPLATDGAGATHGGSAAVFESDCLPPLNNHSVHCHLQSVPAMAAGPSQSLKDDQSVTVAPTPQFLPVQEFAAQFAPAAPIPIGAPPRYILFGNFRS